MILIRKLAPLAMVAAIVFSGCSRSSEKAKVDVPEDQLAAQVDNWKLTRAQLEDFMNKLPDPQKRKFDSPSGRAELAKRLMQEEVSYREAKKMGLQNKDEVKEQIEQATRAILVSAYVKDEVDSKATPTDEEMHAYYDAHPEEFTTLETIRAQHVFSKDSPEKLEKIKKRVEEGGEKFSSMATLYSEDELTAPDGGDLGYFNPGGYIRGIGYSKTFNDAVVGMERGKIYGPIKWEKGYSLVRVMDRTPPVLRPFDECRDDIMRKLTREKLEEVRNAHFDEVMKNYKTRNFMQEEYASRNRGPKELFEFAQASEDPQARIDAFQEIVDKYPDDEHAPEALFMVGFVYAEEMHNRTDADRAFTRLITKYPDSDMAHTARWMLDNMDKPLPKFQDLKDLNRQIEEKKAD